MISLVLFGLAAFFTVPHDKAWVRDVKALWPDGKAFARGVSSWGDYPFIGLIPGLGLGIFGFRSQKRNLARFGLALLLASSTAGLTTNLLRNSLGRPDPWQKCQMAFMGHRFSTSFTALPPGMLVQHLVQQRLSLSTLALGVPALGLASGIASVAGLSSRAPSDRRGFRSFLESGLGLASDSTTGVEKK